MVFNLPAHQYIIHVLLDFTHMKEVEVIAWGNHSFL